MEMGGTKREAGIINREATIFNLGDY